MKKILSIALIVIITTVFGGLMSYVRAAYIEPSTSPVSGNTPAPMLTISNVSDSFIKIGKLGVTDDKSTNPVDASAFANNALVVMGLLTTDSLASNGEFRIRAELDTSSTKFPLFVGDPTSTSLFQNNPNSSPLTFLTKGHTRAPRVVVGAYGLNPLSYNLYVAPHSAATNLGNNNSYCTLTQSQLKNKGCPSNLGYAATNVSTYLGQVFATSSSAYDADVATCFVLTPNAAPANIGNCYPNTYPY